MNGDRRIQGKLFYFCRMRAWNETGFAPWWTLESPGKLFKRKCWCPGPTQSPRVRISGVGLGAWRQGVLRLLSSSNGWQGLGIIGPTAKMYSCSRTSKNVSSDQNMSCFLFVSKYVEMLLVAKTITNEKNIDLHARSEFSSLSASLGLYSVCEWRGSYKSRWSSLNIRQ